MIEFVGSKEILDFAKEEGFETIRMTFENKNEDPYQGDFNVFEVSEEEFEKMCNVPDEDWNTDVWGWFRYSGGCVLEDREPITNININNHSLSAWYDDVLLKDYFSDNEDDGDIQSVFDEWMESHTNYHNLFDYCSDMWGVSTESNITAVAVGLAKLNNMSLATLFSLSIA